MVTSSKKITVARLLVKYVAADSVGLHVNTTAYVFHLLYFSSPVVVHCRPIVINMSVFV